MRLDWKVALPLIILIVAVVGSVAAKQEDEITLYGRPNSSGTYIYFRNNIIEKEYSSKIFSIAGNESIVEAVKKDKTGIGYVGVGYATKENGQPISGIKILKIAKSENLEPASPLDPMNVKTGKYPIARPLYQYVVEIKEGGLTREFLKFELSDTGEQIIRDTGFYPTIPRDREQNENQFKIAKEENYSGDTSAGNELRIQGSDTMLQLVANMVEAYKENNQNVNITVEGGGSGTGIAALIGGRTNIANSSREMEQEEIIEANKNGINPLEFVIARDCISIIVNEDNPINNLTLKELSKIFSGEITTWDEVR